jgi:hypothetical protein
MSMASKYTLQKYDKEMYEKDKKLVDAVNSKVPYLGRRRLEDATEIAKILKDYGYNGLRVASNQSSNAFMSLDKLANINPGRIVAVAQNMYFEASKRINMFGNPSKNPQSPFYDKKSSLEGKFEDDGQGLLF